ncbi:MAG: GNAT family N-acetyltransferase [Synechococcus sp.]|nr:GNAT family N-acetyltransferase [Synechococcus sp.]
MNPTHTPPSIRQAQTTDIPQLAQLYYETVRRHAPTYYTEAQTQAWASFAQDAKEFRQLFDGVITFVLEADQEILGFGSLAADGHVKAIYVRSDRLGEGLGSQLLQTIIHQGAIAKIHRLYAEASEFSLGLFLKFGFQQFATESIERNGVVFQRHLVEKVIDGH